MIISFISIYLPKTLFAQENKTHVEFKEIFSINDKKSNVNMISHKFMLDKFYLTIIDGKLTIINIISGVVKSSQITLPHQDLPGGGIVANDQNIFIFLSDGNVFRFNWKLDLIDKYKYKHVILSKPLLHKDKIYFVDYNNSLVEINYITRKEKVCTTQFVSNNCSLPLSAPIFILNHIVFLSSYGHVIFVDLNNFTVSSIGMDYKSSFNTSFPLLVYKRSVVFCSDSETICIEFNNQNKPIIKWSCAIGSHKRPHLKNNKLVISGRSTIETINLDNDQRQHRISCIRNVVNTFIINNLLLIFTEEGEVFGVDLKNCIYTKEKNNLFKDYESIDFFQYNQQNFISISKHNSTTLYALNVTYS